MTHKMINIQKIFDVQLSSESKYLQPWRLKEKLEFHKVQGVNIQIAYLVAWQYFEKEGSSFDTIFSLSTSISFIGLTCKILLDEFCTLELKTADIFEGIGKQVYIYTGTWFKAMKKEVCQKIYNTLSLIIAFWPLMKAFFGGLWNMEPIFTDYTYFVILLIKYQRLFLNQRDKTFLSRQIRKQATVMFA